MNENATTAAAARRSTNWILTVFLFAGPLITVNLLLRGIGNGTLTAVTPLMYLGAALLFWSPLPFSVPAVLLDNYRDAALTQLRGVLGWPVRAVALIPHLMLAPSSPIRVEMTAAVAGWVLAIGLAAPALIR